MHSVCATGILQIDNNHNSKGRAHYPSLTTIEATTARI